MSNRDEDAIRRVRRICLALPGAIEQSAWGEPTFRVRKKLFAMFASAETHHGGGVSAVWVNAPLGVREHLTETAPGTYFVPPYVGPRGWMGIRLDEVSDEKLTAHVLDSYGMVAPKKLLLLL